MKQITLNIYSEDLRRGTIKSDCAPLENDRNLLETKELGTGYEISKIDYKEDIIYGTTYKKDEIAFVAGKTYDLSDNYYKRSFSFTMKDDGIPCNEETLELKIYCRDTAKHLEQETTLPYRVGASTTLTPHPYQITVLSTNDEEVEIEIKDKDKTTKHLVQLDTRVERNDEYGYATGSPNDPWDTHGPKVYVYLVRK